MQKPGNLNLPNDSQALACWLDSLTDKDTLASSMMMYNAISAIKKSTHSYDAEVLFSFAEACLPHALQQADLLENLYLKNPKHSKLINLAMSLLRNLANLYTQTFTQLTDEQKLLALLGLQYLLSHVHYLRVLSYQPHSESIWRDLGKVFKWTCQFELTRTPTNPTWLPETSDLTLETLCKHHLLFSCCNAYSLQPAEIQNLYRLSRTLGKYVQLNRLGPDTKEGFCWEYDGSDLPKPIKKRPEQSDHLLFNVESLLHAQRIGQIDWPFPQPERILAPLSQYLEFTRNTPPVLPRHHVFVAGLKQVILFYRRHLKDGRVSLISSPAPDQLNFSSLDLYQEPSPIKQVDHVTRDDIWGIEKNKSERNLEAKQFGALKTFATNAPNYVLFESIKVSVKPGDVLVLYGKQLTPQLAFVRRLNTADAKIQKGLLEIIVATVQPFDFFDSKQSRAGLRLTHPDGQHSLLLTGKINLPTQLHASLGGQSVTRLTDWLGELGNYAISEEQVNN